MDLESWFNGIANYLTLLRSHRLLNIYKTPYRVFYNLIYTKISAQDQSMAAFRRTRGGGPCVVRFRCQKSNTALLLADADAFS